MRSPRRRFYAGLLGAAISVLLALLAVVWLGARRVTPILMYHSIGGNGEIHSVSERNFERQMDFLKRSGYAAISLDELAGSIKEGKRFVPRTVVITFDDGFEDNFTNAFPILAKRGFTATFFIITDCVGAKDGYLSADQILLMRKNGMNFGAHSRSHAYLPSVKDDEALWDEVAGSKADLERYTGHTADFFCYPLGAFDERVKEAVRKAGFKGACSTNRGGRLNKDVFALNRIKVTDSDMTRPAHFRAKLSGFYNAFRSKGR